MVKIRINKAEEEILRRLEIIMENQNEIAQALMHRNKNQIKITTFPDKK